MAFEGPCTVKGGMPLWAVCTGGIDDGPCGREYWSEVVSLHWLTSKGGKGKEITQAMMDSIEKYDQYWQAEVTEQVTDYLAYSERDNDMVSFDKDVPKDS
jgi:hypothetical protein